MKLSLLEMVQDILNAVDGSEVNSISDTTESFQIASDIRIVYYDLIGRKDWQFLRKLKQMVSVSNTSKPTHLKLPDNTSKIDTFFYNKKKVTGGRNYFESVGFLFPDEFLAHVNSRDETQSNYTSVTDFDGATFTIRTDVQPTYYTSFDDKYVVLDSYDMAVESTLQGINTQTTLFINPSWTVDNAFIPELPSEMFPLFLAECISYSQARKDGVLLQKTEQTSGRHSRHLAQAHGVVQQGVRQANFGRHSPKSFSYNRSPLFGK